MAKSKTNIEAAQQAIEDADAAVASAVAPYRKTRAVKAVSLLSEIGDQPPMRTVCAAIVAAGLAGGFPRLTRAGLRMAAAHTLATLAKDFVKLRIDRTRPRSRKGGTGHRVTTGRKHAKEETSFPSGHSAGAIAAACAFAREFPEHKEAVLAAAGAVSLAQIPRSAHYPSDVATGLAIGVAADAIVDRLLAPLIEAIPLPDGAD